MVSDYINTVEFVSWMLMVIDWRKDYTDVLFAPTTAGAAIS